MEATSQTLQQNQQDAAWGAIDEHRTGVVRYLRVLGCDRSLAEDLAQEAFVRTLAADFAPRSPKVARAYLRRTARNLLTTRMERRREVAQVDWLDAVDSEWERCGAADDSDAWLEALRRCIASLTGRARDVVLRFYVERQSREEIARALGMRENGVKTALQRARAVLRECIERRMER